MAGRRDDQSAYLRAKAHMAGVRYDTPLDLACDVLFALEVDGVPHKEMGEWRQRLERQIEKTKTPDRETWGTTPEQMAKMGRLTVGSGMKKPRGGITSVPPRGGLQKT